MHAKQIMVIYDNMENDNVWHFEIKHKTTKFFDTLL